LCRRNLKFLFAVCGEDPVLSKISLPSAQILKTSSAGPSPKAIANEAK
jgi:hypothetical protein